MATTSVGQYLFERLKQLGVKTVFGVPGDYELILLDMIPEAGLSWKGNPNELNASYAADGYGRVNGVGAVVCTFGPGELSAFAGIAGSYCEFVPVAFIVGYPTVRAQQTGAIMHHSLGDGRFEEYHSMAKHITVATTVLNDAAVAASEIDRCLEQMIYHSRPVYIGVPVDIGPRHIDSTNLKSPLQTTLTPNDKDAERQLVSRIADIVSGSESAVAIVDGGAVRAGIVDAAVRLIEALGIPYFATAMSKGYLNERGKAFGGVYVGVGSTSEECKQAVETADCVIWVGQFASDFNTAEFSEKFAAKNVVDFERLWVSVNNEKVELVGTYALEALTAEVHTRSKLKRNPTKTVTWSPYEELTAPTTGKLTQDYLWNKIGSYFQTNDFAVVETGTSSAGIAFCPLLGGDDCKQIQQTVYGSIGWATGAAVGVFQARKELGSPGRSVLITGEGSLQLTVQALSDILRHDLNVTMFLLNNNGYTIERCIHGMHQDFYNAVPVWDYKKMFALFGPDKEYRYDRVATCEELGNLLNDKDFNNPTRTQLVELILDFDDAPTSVRRATAAVEEFNRVKT